jgi:hypothetical protein
MLQDLHDSDRIHWVTRGTPLRKIETRLIDESLVSVMGECVTKDKIYVWVSVL